MAWQDTEQLVGFSFLVEKIRKTEESNSQKIRRVFMNLNGNYHVSLEYFLETNGFIVYKIDARKTVHLRKMMNLNAEKSDTEDSHILASSPWYYGLAP